MTGKSSLCICFIVLEVFLQRRLEEQTGVECASREEVGGGRQLQCLVLKSTCNYTTQSHNHDIFEGKLERTKQIADPDQNYAEALM